MAYAPGCDLLHDVLPVDEKLNAETMRQHLFQAAERMEGELGEERASLIEGGDEDWEQLPTPDGPLTVGLDGGFVRARHKRGCFEVIVGKSVLEFKRDDEGAEKSQKCFGYVQAYDEKPRRRLFELLKSTFRPLRVAAFIECALQPPLPAKEPTARRTGPPYSAAYGDVGEGPRTRVSRPPAAILRTSCRTASSSEIINGPRTMPSTPNARVPPIIDSAIATVCSCTCPRATAGRTTSSITTVAMPHQIPTAAAFA